MGSVRGVAPGIKIIGCDQPAKLPRLPCWKYFEITASFDVYDRDQTMRPAHPKRTGSPCRRTAELVRTGATYWVPLALIVNQVELQGPDFGEAALFVTVTRRDDVSNRTWVSNQVIRLECWSSGAVYGPRLRLRHVARHNDAKRS